MSYAVLQDLIDRYGAAELTDLTDRSGTGSPDATVAGVALSDATATIDGYLAGRYQLPLNPVPAVAIQWCCQIARFLLYTRTPNDAVTLVYKSTISALQAAESGAMTLEAAGIDTAVNTDTVELLAGTPRQFGVQDTHLPEQAARNWGGY